MEPGFYSTTLFFTEMFYVDSHVTLFSVSHRSHFLDSIKFRATEINKSQSVFSPMLLFLAENIEN